MTTQPTTPSRPDTGSLPEDTPRPGLGGIAADVGARLITDPSGTLFVIGALGLLALGSIGLPLAWLGVYRAWLVIPLVLAATVALLAAWWRGGLDRVVRSERTSASVVVLGVVIVFVVLAAGASSQHLLADRDPGVYVVTARWMSGHGNLLFDTGFPSELIAGLTSDQGWWSQGLYPQADGTSYFQFSHLLPSVMAIGSWLGGDGVMLRVPAMLAGLALLGVYLLGRRFAGEWAGALAVIGLALHPATMHFAKDAYSEFLAMAFVAAGLALWMDAAESHDRRLLIGSGAMIGAVTMARIDGWMVVLGFIAGLAAVGLVGRWERRQARREFAWVLAGIAWTGAIGLLDQVLRSPVYLSDLGDRVVLLLIGTAVAATVLAAVLAPSDEIRERLAGWLSRGGAVAAGAAVVLLGVFAQFVRPHVTTSRGGPIGLIAALQAREGVAVDATRRYAEDSLVWFARIAGHPFVLLTVLAVAALTFAALRSRDVRQIPLVSVGLVAAAIYIWQPSITPDQLWALRRFLPVVLPFGFLALAWLAARAATLHRRAPVALLALSIPLALGAAQMVRTGAPLLGIRTQAGVLAATLEACDRLPDGAGVMMDDDVARTYLVAIRAYCDVPVLGDTSAEITEAVQRSGYRPVVISTEDSCVAGDDLGTVSTAYELPERTATRVPSGAETERLAIRITDIGGDGPDGSPFPAEAAAGLEVVVLAGAVDTTQVGEVASIGDPSSRLSIQFDESGRPLLVFSAPGQVVSLPISGSAPADGLEHRIGGYVTDDTLVTMCGGRVTASAPIDMARAPAGDPLLATTPDDSIRLSAVVSGG